MRGLLEELWIAIRRIRDEGREPVMLHVHPLTARHLLREAYEMMVMDGTPRAIVWSWDPDGKTVFGVRIKIHADADVGRLKVEASR